MPKRTTIMMIAIAVVGVVVVMAIYVVSVSNGEGKTEEVENTNPGEADYILAIELAEDFLKTLDKDPADYKVIKVENLVSYKGMYQGPNVWHITFKRADLIPETDYDMVGAGGEIFISVNLKERSANLLGYGE